MRPHQRCVGAQHRRDARRAVCAAPRRGIGQQSSEDVQNRRLGAAPPRCAARSSTPQLQSARGAGLAACCAAKAAQCVSRCSGHRIATAASGGIAPAPPARALCIASLRVCVQRAAPRRRRSAASERRIAAAFAGGRATHYGGGDKISSSLDAGSCMMKIDGPKYVAAINTAGSSNTDKCGQCYEVRARGRPARCARLLSRCASGAGDVRGRAHPRHEQQPVWRRSKRLPRPRTQGGCGAGDRQLPVRVSWQSGQQQHVVLRRQVPPGPELHGASAAARGGGGDS